MVMRDSDIEAEPQRLTDPLVAMRPPPWQNRVHVIARWSVAGVLVLAATAKSRELSQNWGDSFGTAIVLLWPACLITAEVLLAAALSAGTWPRLTRFVAILLFAAFSAVSFSKVLAGDTSCGCFGDVTISPWAALMLDLVVLTLLVFGDPGPATASATPFKTNLCAACGAFAIPLTVVAMTFARPAATIADPQHWIGEDFPLLGYIDGGDTLAEGEWAIAFVRPGCPKCAELLSELRTFPKTFRLHSPRARLAVLLVGAESVAIELPDRTSAYSLSPEYGGSIETPLLVWLQDGQVSAVHRHFPGTAPY
jgi:hypothetical protein